MKLRKHNNTSAINNKFEKESFVLPKRPLLIWMVSKWFNKRFLTTFSLQLGERGQYTKRYSQFSAWDTINLRLIIILHPFSLFEQYITKVWRELAFLNYEWCTFFEYRFNLLSKPRRYLQDGVNSWYRFFQLLNHERYQKNPNNLYVKGI